MPVATSSRCGSPTPTSAPRPPSCEALSRTSASTVFSATARRRPSCARRSSQRLERLYGWRIDPSWIVFTPGVVPGLHLAARQLVPAGRARDHPAAGLPPLRKAHGACAAAVHAKLRWSCERRALGFRSRALQKGITPKTKAFFLCNPQNPGGTVFRRAELERLAELIARPDHRVRRDPLRPGARSGPAARADRQPRARDLAPHGHADVGQQDLQLPRRRLRLGGHRGPGSAQGVLRARSART